MDHNRKLFYAASMKLADFLSHARISPAKLRRDLGITGRSTVTRWLTGERLPNHHMIHRITLYTKGQVQLVDFLDRKALPKCATVVTLLDGRKKIVFPWSSRDAELDACIEALAEEDAEGDRLSGPIQDAVATLGPTRVKQLPNQQFLLDGRPASPIGLVTAANRERIRMGLAPIAYLGAFPGATP